MSLGIKKCSKCEVLKPVCFGHFYRQAATSDGYTSWCRDCDRTKCREYRRMQRAKGIVQRVPVEKSREYNRIHRHKDIEKTKHASRLSAKKRREDPVYRAMANMGRRVRDMLSGVQGSTRHLPYTSSELKRHMERQFVGEMNWENYGSCWHIDHIIPVFCFKSKEAGDEEFNACWALTNLRPLLKLDNLSKSYNRKHLI